MESVAESLGFVGFMVVVAWIVHISLRSRRQAQLIKHQAEMHARLLEKFGSGQELIGYLKSEAGHRFLEMPAVESRNPYRRILGSIQTGVILGLVGLAFLYLRGQMPDGEEGFVFLGALGLALGVGFLASAAIAYVLSKSWGLINGNSDRGGSS